MFYEKEEIENELFKCPSCSLIYDIPYILPCGEMICNRCLNKLTEHGRTKLVSCQHCKGIHNVPHDGFLVQKRLANMLNKKPKKIFRGVEFERAEKTLDEVKIFINEFYKSIGDVKANFKRYCDDLRDSVETDAKLAIEEHEISKQKMLSDIDIYERKCFEQMQYESHLQKNYSTFLRESNEKLDRWYETLNRAELTKSDIDKILNEALSLRLGIITEMDMLNNLFKDKLLKFYKHSSSTAQLQEEHFGKLYYEAELHKKLAKLKELKDAAADENDEELNDFITFKEFLSTLLSPVSHICFTILNYTTNKLENINNKFQETLLSIFMSLYSIYTQS